MKPLFYCKNRLFNPPNHDHTMAIKYEIHKLNNAGGSGQDRRYVRIHRGQTLTESELESAIEHSCTATRADVRGVLAALRQVAEQQLALGNRFHLPGIGWLAVTAGLSKEAQQADHKVTGKDIYPTGIQFQPEGDLFERVTTGMTFHQSPFTTQSAACDEQQLWQLISDHIDQRGCITRSELRQMAGLAKNAEVRWLDHFMAQGLLREGGTPHLRLYFKV